MHFQTIYTSAVLPPVTRYLQCVDYLNLIKNELSEFGIQDFIGLDAFFWHIIDDVMSEQDKKTLLWDLNARNHEVALLKIKHKRLREKYGEGEIPCESKTGTGPILLSWDLMAHKSTLSSVH